MDGDDLRGGRNIDVKGSRRGGKFSPSGQGNPGDASRQTRFNCEPTSYKNQNLFPQTTLSWAVLFISPRLSLHAAVGFLPRTLSTDSRSGEDGATTADDDDVSQYPHCRFDSRTAHE